MWKDTRLAGGRVWGLEECASHGRRVMVCRIAKVAKCMLLSWKKCYGSQARESYEMCAAVMGIGIWFAASVKLWTLGHGLRARESCAMFAPVSVSYIRISADQPIEDLVFRLLLV